ncbi:aromatic ring-hydroxylating oxygenase subunit alpha [Hwanghaeella sp.]|uniref:aromatic ring-hydroxylating oxygenase subunit alpha n=1 Tax=Hwanghaeella sp. TaxID=2605943 RepID=UPI003CCB74E5
MVARTLPPDCYLPDPAAHRGEVDLLRGEWAILAHEGAVPTPGDNLALELFGIPILLRRDAAGGLAAYPNACPHRGGPLAWPGQSSTRLLQCRYHGWTFRPDGGLIEPVGFGAERSELHCAGLGLKKLRIHCRNGLILACLADTGGDRSAPPLPEELESRLSDSVLVATETIPASCNWKLYAENWLEPYHLQSLHRDLSADVRGETYRVRCGPDWSEHRAVPQKGTYGGYWAFLYPATAINFYVDGFSIEQINPLSETNCAVQYQFYRFTGTGREDGIASEIALTRTVTGEDVAAAEHVQKSLTAGIFETGYVSAEREAGILALHEFLRRGARRG